MRLLANDLSIHGQFHDIPSFHSAFEKLMAMRKIARSFGREVYCHQKFLTIEAIPGVQMQKALGRFTKDKQRAAMLWLTRGGPFWDDDDFRPHGVNDWLECRGEIVTDSAVGEAGFQTLNGSECGLISVKSSDWDFSPVKMIWKREPEDIKDKAVCIENWRDAATLENRLRNAAEPIRSWDDLQDFSTKRFQRLTFANDCFDHLKGVPFAKSSADRIRFLLDTLDRLARSFDAKGKRNPEGQSIYQNHFKGDKACFSDSSDQEKSKFHEKLTFSHPNDPQRFLFCPWHGKVNQGTLRLHFSWPVRYDKPVYVVYVGQKITKR